MLSVAEVSGLSLTLLLTPKTGFLASSQAHMILVIQKGIKNAEKITNIKGGAQWLSGRVLDLRPRGAGSSLTGVTALWSLSKTHLS